MRGEFRLGPAPPVHAPCTVLDSASPANAKKALYHIAFSTSREFCERRCKVCTTRFSAGCADRESSKSPYFTGFFDPRAWIAGAEQGWPVLGAFLYVPNAA